jgi:hypothetical protein
MGQRGGVSLRVVALQRGTMTVVGSCSMGVSREVREVDQLKKKRGVGSAHRKRIARQGWRLSDPIPTRGGGLGAQALSGRGRDVKEGGGARAAGVCSGKEKGDGAAMVALIATRERVGGGPGLIHAEEGKKGGLGVDGAWSGDGYGMRMSGASGSLRAAVPGRARERPRKGERELAGGLAPPISERRRERESAR